MSVDYQAAGIVVVGVMTTAATVMATRANTNARHGRTQTATNGSEHSTLASMLEDVLVRQAELQHWATDHAEVDLDTFEAVKTDLLRVTADLKGLDTYTHTRMHDLLDKLTPPLGHLAMLGQIREDIRALAQRMDRED